MLSPLVLYPHGQMKPATYTVKVQAVGKTSGNFLLGFYLPGDANGDGVVNKTDLQIVKASMNTRATSPKYNFNADVNRDGRIGKIDLAFTQQNQGVTTDVFPMVEANYDSSHDINPLNPRTTNVNSAHFTGIASGGATITYAEVSQKVPPTTTTADAAGNYSINVPLAPGTNTFQVTSIDSFGQTISGDDRPGHFHQPDPDRHARVGEFHRERVSVVWRPGPSAGPESGAFPTSRRELAPARPFGGRAGVARRTRPRRSSPVVGRSRHGERTLDDPSHGGVGVVGVSFQGLDRGHGCDPAEGPGRGPSDDRVGVVEPADQGRHGLRRAAPSQDERGVSQQTGASAPRQRRAFERLAEERRVG